MVLEQLQRLSVLSKIDEQIEELREELGELPFEVEEQEKRVRVKQAEFDENEAQVKAAKEVQANGNQEIQTLKDEVERLRSQQAEVRNNREYDAITNELQTCEKKQEEVSAVIAQARMTEENLTKRAEDLESALSELKERLSELEGELSSLSDSQSSEMTELISHRNTLSEQITADWRIQYERITEYHVDAVVEVRRGSCTGCFSVVPPQAIVEMRKFQKIHECEQCGRILYPEEMPEETFGIDL